MQQAIGSLTFHQPIFVTHRELAMRFTGPVERIQLAGIELIENVRSPMRYRADPNGHALLMFRIEQSAYTLIKKYASRRGLQSHRAIEYTELFSAPFRLGDMTIVTPLVWPITPPALLKIPAFSKAPTSWYVGVDTMDFQLFHLFAEHYRVTTISYQTGNAPLTYFQWPHNTKVLTRLIQRYGFSCRHVTGLPYDQEIAQQYHAPEGSYAGAASQSQATPTG